MDGTNSRSVADDKISFRFYNQKREAALEIFPFLDRDVDNFADFFAFQSFFGENESIKHRFDSLFIEIRYRNMTNIVFDDFFKSSFANFKMILSFDHFVNDIEEIQR